ncbi:MULTISPECIES: DeoR family transcriptional regulator [Brevibacillus]|nr:MULTISPECIES: DeoR family transcriptional regulator [Brevibacillus]NRR02571.1 DeoR family transcriptional regulator [Brevibacillus sp. RS1.1]RAT96283.1 DeoR family transcriptional regulator [Brevibacillus sp. Leaf182]
MSALKSTFIGAIYSAPSPLPGQSHRSSSNIGTEVLPPDTVNFQWVISGVSNPNQISFSVSQDVSGGNDPTHLTGVVSEKITDVVSTRSLYIGSPKGAQENFLVEIYALSRA